MRGLELLVRYELDGRITLVDGDELLTEVHADPVDMVDAVGSCAGERFRLVRGHDNRSVDGDHATISVGKVTIDFGPALDALPPSRFDPRAHALRQARRAAARGDWAASRAAMARVEGPSEAERRAVIDEILGRAPDREGWRWAWDLAEGMPERQEIGPARIPLELAAGDPVAARSVLGELPDLDLCELEGDIAWAAGEKRAAKKIWSSCATLSDATRARCPSCP